MTIKQLKEKYNGRYGKDEKTMFTTFDYQDGNGKIVIVVTKNWLVGRTVWQAVRVSDGKELIPIGSCRPCDSLNDAIDVAGEMIEDAR